MFDAQFGASATVLTFLPHEALRHSWQLEHNSIRGLKHTPLATPPPRKQEESQGPGWSCQASEEGTRAPAGSPSNMGWSSAPPSFLLSLLFACHLPPF